MEIIYKIVYKVLIFCYNWMIIISLYNDPFVTIV